MLENVKAFVKYEQHFSATKVIPFVILAIWVTLRKDAWPFCLQKGNLHYWQALYNCTLETIGIDNTNMAPGILKGIELIKISK